MMMYADSVSIAPHLEPKPSVVRKSRSVSVQHLLQRYKRYGECSRQAVVAG